MLASILIGLDPLYHNDERMDSLIRWGQQRGATLVGLGIVDEPGIRALEPAWPVGGTPGVDPVIYRGYEGRLAEVNRQVDFVLERFAAALRQGRSQPRRIQSIRVASRVDRARGANLRFDRPGSRCSFPVPCSRRRQRTTRSSEYSKMHPGRCSSHPTARFRPARSRSLMTAASRPPALWPPSSRPESPKEARCTWSRSTTTPSTPPVTLIARSSFSPITRSRRYPTSCHQSANPAQTILEQCSPPGRRAAGDGCLRSAGLARVPYRISHPYNVERVPRTCLLLPLSTPS